MKKTIILSIICLSIATFVLAQKVLVVHKSSQPLESYSTLSIDSLMFSEDETLMHIHSAECQLDHSFHDTDSVTLVDLSFPLGVAVSTPEYYTGKSYILPMVQNDNVYNMPSMDNISFEPTVRNNWHSHAGGQILLVSGGVGYYQEEGQTAKILRKGDVVRINPNVKHWHGAFPDTWFSHIEIATNPDRVSTEWMEAVTNDYYNNLTAEEFANRGTLNNFMFTQGSASTNNPLFTGTVYLSTILNRDNTFNCPSIMNVVFEPGVRNNMHGHRGGQILIATDGIGYHYIEGGELEILYPGDVAKCPPGGNHWHGSVSDWFAHLAIMPN